MEAVPRLYMFHCDLKNSPSHADFSAPLKKYIRLFYHENPDSYEKEIKELNGLRQAMCKVPHDFTGCSILKRYYSQLCLLQNRFPMTDDGPACVPFTWSDIYSYGTTVSITDIKYEQACVLHNIGALHSLLGASDTRSDAEGMKMACTHFQCAAWAFQHLRDTYPQPKGSDMSHDILTCKMNIMLAQAQECILEKSMLDNRKSSITAKVAAQVVDYYRCALGILVSNTPSGMTVHDVIGSKTFKDWKKYIEFKMAYYMSISHFFMGNYAEEQQKMGERVAWYQSATEFLNEAIKTSKNMDKDSLNESLTFLVDVIGGIFNSSKKENDFVYHEKVPPINTLPVLKGASLVKGIPFDPVDPDVCGVDIFSRLVPMTAMYSNSMYSEEKAKILRSVMAAVEEKDEELSTYLSSLQLDKNIFKEEKEEIPQELMEKCAALSVRPTALSDLTSVMSELKDTSSNVEVNLKLCADLLSEEDLKEKKHQEIFGKRVPSMITVELKKERSKLEEAHKKASESNKTLQNAASTHIDNLLILGSSLQELRDALPSKEKLKTPDTVEAMQNFQKLLSKVGEMEEQRLFLVQQLRESLHKDDITKRLVALDNMSDAEKLFEEELKKHDQCISYIRQNIAAQENILSAITETNAGFADVRKSILTEINRREIMINSLIASYEAYDDLIEKGKKGLEFYKKLKSSVSKLLDRIRSVTKVQDEERAQRAGADRPKGAAVPNMPNAMQVVSKPKLKDYLPHLVNSKVPPVAPLQANMAAVSAYPQQYETPTDYVPSRVGQQDMPHDQQAPAHSVPASRTQTYQPPPAQSTYNPYNATAFQETSHPVPAASAHFRTSDYKADGSSANVEYSTVKSMGTDSKSSFIYNSTVPGNQVPTSPSAAPHLSGLQNVPLSINSSVNPLIQKSEPSYYPSTSYNLSYPNSNISASSVYPSHGSSTLYHQNYGEMAPQIPANVNSGRTFETYSSGTCIPHPGIATSNYYPYSAPNATKFPPVSTQYSSVAPYSNSETMYSSSSGFSAAMPTNARMQVPQANVMPTPNQHPYYNTTVNPNQQYNAMPYANSEAAYLNAMAHSSSFPNISADNANSHLQINAEKSQFVSTSNAYINANYTNTTGSQIYLASQANSGLQMYPSGSQVYSAPTQTGSGSQPYHVPTQTGSGSQPYVLTQTGSGSQPYVPTQTGSGSQPYSVPTQTGSGSQPYSVPTQTGSGSQPYSVPAQTGSQVYPVQAGSSSQLYSVPAHANSSSQVYPAPYQTGLQAYPAYSQAQNNVNPINQFHNQSATSVLEATSIISQEPLQPQTADSEKKKVPLDPGVNANCDKWNQPKKNIKKSPSFDRKEKPYQNSGSLAELLPTTSVQNQINHKDMNIGNGLTPEQSKQVADLNLLKPKHMNGSAPKDPFSDPSVQMKFVAEVEKYEKLVEGLIRKSLNGTTPLDQKWKELMDTQEKESRKMSISVARCYPLKNRVPDIMPYDSNRVELVSSKDDYINASYMKDLLPSGPVFVITQAPLPSTFCDFWLMVWEQQVETLVCLLSPTELKNHVYWPKERGVPATHGIFDLTLQSQKENGSFTERIISINNNKTKTSRNVVHLQFNEWYSSKVPVIPKLLHFVSTVLNYYSQQRTLNRPLVVHCSSGVGRSGIFCLITALVSEISNGHGPRDVSSVALRMCTQRKFIIQDKEHLKFCYSAILSYAQSLLEKRGILTRKLSFDEKSAQSCSQSETDLAKLQFNLSMASLRSLTEPKFSIQPKDSDSTHNENLDTPSVFTAEKEEKSVTEKETSNDQQPLCSENGDGFANITTADSSVESNSEQEAPVEVSTVSSILDPNNFTLDSQNTPLKRRITKDTFMHSTGVLSRASTDSSDPLSSLDPMWSLKKM